MLPPGLEYAALTGPKSVKPKPVWDHAVSKEGVDYLLGTPGVDTVDVPQPVQGARQARTGAAATKNRFEDMQAGLNEVGCPPHTHNRTFDGIHVPDHVHGDIDVEAVDEFAFGILPPFAAHVVIQFQIDCGYLRHAFDLDVLGKAAAGENLTEVR